MIDKDLLNARETREYFRISHSTLNRWVRAGILKPLRVGPRGDRKFKREDILSLLKEE